jgi:hypothetical protein
MQREGRGGPSVYDKRGSWRGARGRGSPRRQPRVGKKTHKSRAEAGPVSLLRWWIAEEARVFLSVLSLLLRVCQVKRMLVRLCACGEAWFSTPSGKARAGGGAHVLCVWIKRMCVKRGGPILLLKSWGLPPPAELVLCPLYGAV